VAIAARFFTLTMKTNQQTIQTQKRVPQAESDQVAELRKAIARRRLEGIVAYLVRNEAIRNGGGFIRTQ